MDHERIIHILDYLSRYTDENRFVSISQIQDHLAVVCNLSRVKDVTIRRDLDRLTTMGNNIVKVNREHNKAYYALIDKGFSFNEIRFIVDSISINKFLTAAQKQQLIHVILDAMLCHHRHNNRPCRSFEQSLREISLLLEIVLLRITQRIEVISIAHTVRQPENRVAVAVVAVSVVRASSSPRDILSFSIAG